MRRYKRRMAYAERAFHKMNDDYRREIVGLEERFIKQYNTIVSDGDIVSKDAAGHDRFKRLDMAKSAVRDKVSHAMTNDELDHIFETDGFFM